MAPRPRLGTEIKRRLKSRGYTLVAASGELGINVNSLRSWIRRNTFPSTELERIAKIAGLSASASALEQEFDFFVAGVRRTYDRELVSLGQSQDLDLAQALGLISSGDRVSPKRGQRLDQELGLLFAALSSGDLYVHWSLDVLPHELEPAGWNAIGVHVIRAVEKGASLLYFYPGPRLLEAAQGMGIPSVVRPETFLPLLDTCYSKISSGNSKLTLDEVKRRVHCACYDEFLFASPGHSYVLLGHGGVPLWDRYTLLVCPTIRTDVQESPLMLILDRNTTASFVEITKVAISRSVNSDTLSLFP